MQSLERELVMKKHTLDGMKILVVDDEPDVLETLSELLSMCNVIKAETFEEAKKCLDNEVFDFAILDIMGVNGYELLELAKNKKMLVVMLTANALSVKDTVRSFKGGAASFVPKEKVSEIPTYLMDIIDAHQKGTSFVSPWMKRLGAFYEERFGKNWKKDDKGFWEKFGYWV